MCGGGINIPAIPRPSFFLISGRITELWEARTRRTLTSLRTCSRGVTTASTLREGIADYVALKIRAIVGPNAGGDDLARRNIAPEIIEHLGTTKPAPEWVSTDPTRRSDYYFASYRLVKYLVESKGIETFWKLYAAENPEIDIKNLYGLDRKEAIQAALGSREQT